VGAFADEVAFELGERAEDVKDEAAARQAAAEPVELPDDERVAGPEVVERAGELGALGDRAPNVAGTRRVLASHAHRVRPRGTDMSAGELTNDRGAARRCARSSGHGHRGHRSLAAPARPASGAGHD
jgi:hypothetical protein